MANIKVNTDNLHNVSQELSVKASSVEDIQRRIRNLVNRLNLQTAQAGAIRRTLNSIASSCDDNAQIIRRLASVLDEIAVLYEQAERQNAKFNDSNRSGSDASDIRKEIEFIGGLLGMDTAALFSDDPVNLSNGNYVYEKTFFGFDTVLPMNFRMFYNACSKTAGDLGIGWLHNFEKKIRNEKTRVQVIMEDGSAQNFTSDEKGTFTAYPGTQGTLVRQSSGWIFTDEEQDRYFFDVSGRFTGASTPDNWSVALRYENEKLSRVECTDNISLHFAYDDSDRLCQLSDHTGRTVVFTYQDGILTQVQDPAGQITSYLYDENGRLCEITAPTGDLSVKNHFDPYGRTIQQDFADGGTVTYQYIEDQKAVVMTRQNKSEVTYYHDDLFRNVRTVYANGEEHITYNNNNQRTSFTDKLGRTSFYNYDAAGRLQELINTAGNKLSFEYNSGGQLVRFLMDEVTLHQALYDAKGHQVLSIDAEGHSTQYEYDALGRVLAVTHEDGSKTSLEYDDKGNVVCVVDPITGCTRYSYDACRRVVRSEDALGNQTHYEYDANDRLIQVTDALGQSRNYVYDPRGNLVRIVDFNGGITGFEYNAMNRPVAITDPDGNTTRFAYDQMSNMIQRFAADGGITEMCYDAENRRIGIRYPMGGEEKAEYDAVGNLVRRTAQDGGVFLFEYDVLDRPVKITDPVSGSRSATYDKQSNITAIDYEDGTQERFTYDGNGNQLTHTDQSGYTRYFKYNPLGRLTQVSDHQGILAEYTYGPGGQLLKESSIDGSTTEYSYDVAGNVIRVTDNVHGTWIFEYDALNRMCKAEHVGVGTECYEYDPLGNICAMTDAEGNRTTYRYSMAGALEKVTDARGNEVGYRYDNCHRLHQILRPECGRFHIENMDAAADAQKIFTTTYERDEDGNVISILDSDNSLTLLGYDACGRIIHKKDADGNVLTCTYRLDGTEDMLTFGDGRTIRYQYDALKRLAEVEDWLGITKITRDEMGRVLEVSDPAGHTTGYSWNERGQCTSLRYPDGSTVNYEYSAANHLSGLQTTGARIRYVYYQNGQLRQKHLSNAMCVDYSYDTLGRITGISFCQDGIKTDSFDYTYNASSRKSQIREFHAGQPEKDYGFFYDALGSLTEVTCNGQLCQRYEYDSFGNRSRMTIGNQTTDYGYNSLGQLQWSRSNGRHTSYQYDKRGNLTGETVDGMQRLTLHFDALDRLAKVVSVNGMAEYTYNGMSMLSNVRRSINGVISNEQMVYDYVGDRNRVIGRQSADGWENTIWDNEPVFAGSAGEYTYLLNDERMSTFGIAHEGSIHRCSFDPFGNMMSCDPKASAATFTGYRMDPITGYYDGGWRQYDASVGRFISKDPVAGSMDLPISMNPYLYCMCDPINVWDPTGMIAAWLAGGIVGAVVNVGTKFAGDVVKSVKNGKWSGSSWQSYVGTATGGFVSGTVFVASGGNAALAGAAGSATETLVGNGLSMATGAKGYTKADGYNIGTLLKDTSISAAKGAASGFVFGTAAKHLKIPGITAGRGNYSAVWKQVMTKAASGQIANVTMSTLYKGLVSYGLVKTADTIISKGKEAIKEKAKEKGIEWISGLFDRDNGNKNATSISEIFRGCQTATCATT